MVEILLMHLGVGYGQWVGKKSMQKQRVGENAVKSPLQLRIALAATGPYSSILTPSSALPSGCLGERPGSRSDRIYLRFPALGVPWGAAREQI